MLPIRTILHPTDFSSHSEVAFRLACSLARDYCARLFVLHVVAPPVIVYGGGPAPPQSERYPEELQEKLHLLQAKDPKVQVEHRLAEGDPVTEILRVAEEIKCDALVMGTHGRTGLGRLLMGSVAEGVVRKAPCPVLTVKSPLPHVQTSEESMAEQGGQNLEATKP